MFSPSFLPSVCVDSLIPTSRHTERRCPTYVCEYNHKIECTHTDTRTHPSLELSYHRTAGAHIDTSPTIRHSKHISPPDLSGLGNAQACLDPSTPVDNQRPGMSSPSCLPRPRPYPRAAVGTWGDSRHMASTHLMHTHAHTHTPAGENAGQAANVRG